MFRKQDCGKLSIIFLATSLTLSISIVAQIKPGAALTVPGKTGNTTPNLPGSYSVSSGNFVRTWVPQQAFAVNEADVVNSTDILQVVKSTQYFDGLGRPLQTVGWKVSPDLQDIVAPIRYDEFGREEYKYLPYRALTSDGLFKTNPFGDQKTFYSTIYPLEQPALNGEQFYYSHTQFEPSPLNRPLKTFAPGNSWAGSEITGTDRVAAEKAVSIKYLTNTILDAVRIWDIGFAAFADNANIPTSNTGREYLAGQLYKTVTLDEQSNAVVEYKDKEGQIVLKKVQVGTIAADYSGFGGFLSTYYIYDDFGQLRFVIPPKAVAKMTNSVLTTPIINELCFRYEYDGRQRMIAKKVPGAAWVYMVYDKRDRLCFTQDGNLRSKQQWTYNLYDELNRPVETGIVYYPNTWASLVAATDAANSSIPVSRPTSGTYVNTSLADLIITDRDFTVGSYNATNSIEFNAGFTSENGANFIAEILPSTAQTFSTTLSVNMVASLTGATWYPLTYTYYDNYPTGTTKSYSAANNGQLNDGGGNTSATLEALPVTNSTLTKGMVTGTRVRVIENPDNLALGSWLETMTYYDDKGRAVQVQADNYKGGKDIATTRYNFTNKPVATYQVHTNPAGGKGGTNNVGVKTSILYDHAGRITKTTKTVVYQSLSYTRTTAQNIYDALGQVKNKKIGQKSATDAMEIENDQYSYNIRGWLKGVNYYGASYAAQENTANNKWLAFDLNYDWGMAVGTDQQYNGNIAGTRWKSAGDHKERAFGYSYDPANRLLLADFTQNNSGWAPDPVLKFDVKMGSGVNDGSAYDENGNIKRMQQWGLAGIASQKIDDLSYAYASSELSNKLLSVLDNGIQPVTNIGDFKDKNVGSSDYGYDLNGNLITDKNKRMNGVVDIDQTGVGAIIYNHLNLPYKITASNDDGSLKGTITYIYDAVGNKLEKRTVEGTKQTQTSYVSGYVYENNKLQFLGHEEGRIRFKQTIDGATSQPVTLFVYDYFLKDHLGNVRMVLTDEVRQDVYPAASLEDNGIAVEKNYYDIKDGVGGSIVPKSSYPAFTAAAGSNYQNHNGSPPYNNNPSLNVNAESQQLYKLNGASGLKFGLGTTLKVMTGDNVAIYGRSFYHLNSGQNANNGYAVSSALLNLLTSFTGGSAVSGKGITGTSLNGNLPTTTPLSSLLNGTTPSATPGAAKAGINWILFDEQFRPVSVGFDPVDGAEVIKTHSRNAAITQNGYLYVYCSDESNVDVFFDNFQVIHNRGALVEETHYYPFGLSMAGISSEAATGANYPENKKGFNGNELQSKEFLDLSGSAWYDFNARTYDPQTGRFIQIDPLSDEEDQESLTPYHFTGNNPIRFNDPDGKCGWCDRAMDAIVETGKNVGAGVLGAVNAFTSDNVGGLGRSDGSHLSGSAGASFRMGQKVGDVAAIVTGALEDAVGGASLALSVGGSAPASVPLVIHGTTTAAIAISNLIKAEAKGSESNPHTSSRAARRDAMRKEGLPTSQQPTTQRQTAAGRTMEYKVPKAGGGTEKKQVQQQLKDRNHGKHWEAGTLKKGGQKDPAGRDRLQNGKSKSHYE